MTSFEVRVLYPPRTVEIEANDEADARRQVHATHPGWTGTIVSCKEVE